MPIFNTAVVGISNTKNEENKNKNTKLYKLIYIADSKVVVEQIGNQPCWVANAPCGLTEK